MLSPRHASVLGLLAVSLWGASALGQNQLHRQFATTHDQGIFEHEYGLAITANAVGEIYVTGSTEFGPDVDLLTMKLSASGELVWARRYDGPGQGFDAGWMIELDPWGNAIVGADSVGDGTSIDILVHKYDPNGNLLWELRYDGPVSGFDASQGTPSMRIDELGNTYICGLSDGGASSYDSLILKIDPQGNLLWTHRYDGGGNQWDSSYGLYFDPDGDILVGGETVDDFGSYFMAQKLTPDGNLVWESRYQFPGSNWEACYGMTLDPQGRPAVYGIINFSATGNDYGVVKWDNDGNLLWAQTYDGGYGDDIPFFGASDSQGRVALTGVSKRSFDDDSATVLFDVDGSLMWAKTYSGSNSWWGGDSPSTYAQFDRHDRLIIVGWSYAGPTTSHDGHVVMYDALGELIAEDRFDGSSHGYDALFAIHVDKEGAIFVTGASMSDGGTLDCLAIRYGAPKRTTNKNSSMK